MASQHFKISVVREILFSKEILFGKFSDPLSLFNLLLASVISFNMADLKEFIKVSDRIVILELKFKSDSQTPVSLKLYASQLHELWDNVQSIYKKFNQDSLDNSTFTSVNEKYEFRHFRHNARQNRSNDQDLTPVAINPQNEEASEEHSTPLPRLFDTSHFLNNYGFTHSMAMTPCYIPTLKGNYYAGPTFCDLFYLERLFHLFHRTSGEAKSIVQRFSFSCFNFACASLALAAF